VAAPMLAHKVLLAERVGMPHYLETIWPQQQQGTAAGKRSSPLTDW
jgi:hypothetical protein